MISVVILTLNEELNVRRAFESLSWCDDILVVDSFSTDATLEIARGHKTRIFQRVFTDFATQRNAALDEGSLKHDWVFHLDADEVITPALRDELFVAAGSNRYAAYRVASKLMFNGQWLRRAGLYPWHQVRFGRKNSLRFRQVGHGQRETTDPALIGTLSEPMLHYPFEKGLHDWLEKHNRYSTAEARNNIAGDGSPRLRELLSSDNTAKRRAMKAFFARLPFRPGLRFLYMYLWRLGFLDGHAGWTYCRLLKWYEQMIVLKERELRMRARSALHIG